MVLSKLKVVIAAGLTATFMGATAHAQGYYKPTANPDRVSYYTVAGDEPDNTGLGTNPEINARHSTSTARGKVKATWPGAGDTSFSNSTGTTWYKDFDYDGPDHFTNLDTTYKYNVKISGTATGYLAGSTTGGWTVNARASFFVAGLTFAYPPNAPYSATGVGGQPFRIGPQKFYPEMEPELARPTLTISADAGVRNVVSLYSSTAPGGTATVESGENVCTIDTLELNATAVPGQPVGPAPGEGGVPVD